MEILVITATVLAIIYIVKNFILPLIFLKELNTGMDLETICKKYCLIDLRDYITADKNPFPHARNIPLSYLPRELEKNFPCDKKILLISEDKRTARLAAKFIQKQKRDKIYFLKNV
ncbi:hypothetical protein EDD68_1406 [Melghiribacillus thermohalophilus]|uniref:Rhodanese domain-containing protein n=1 Tax=Melghiribacillus thermohalophilus TaxID=1324956 RepID=A0A4R3MQL5_9BACI|nr:rhodanese-like domain-containing protein [Melghiribacillus thermohalophilus]TCT14720.1 hypothetical protein EDD68_1406 [Melghiribacillus thermohalophilus]